VAVDDKFIKYSDEVQKRIDSENAQIQDARKGELISLDFMEPKYPFLKKYKTSGHYGSRRVFNGVPKSPHKGWDIAAPKGAEVHPMANGRVVLTMDSYLSGKMVIISHGYGLFSVYCHLDKIKVKEGDYAGYETVIGNVGATGRVSGPHLHLGLYFMQIALDAELLF